MHLFVCLCACKIWNVSVYWSGILNTFTVVNFSPGPSGRADLIRDNQITIVKGCTRSVGHATSVIVELWAIRDGLTQFSKGNLKVELDAEVITTWLRTVLILLPIPFWNPFWLIASCWWTGFAITGYCIPTVKPSNANYELHMHPMNFEPTISFSTHTWQRRKQFKPWISGNCESFILIYNVIGLVYNFLPPYGNVIVKAFSLNNFSQWH